MSKPPDPPDMPTLSTHNAAVAAKSNLAGVLCDTCKTPMVRAGIANQPHAVYCEKCKKHGTMLEEIKGYRPPVEVKE